MAGQDPSCSQIDHYSRTDSNDHFNRPSKSFADLHPLQGCIQALCAFLGETFLFLFLAGKGLHHVCRGHGLLNQRGHLTLFGPFFRVSLATLAEK